MSHTLLGVCTTCPCPMGYPQPGPRGRYRSKSGGKRTPNIRKLFTNQALEISGGSIGQSLKGSVLSNIGKLFRNQGLERSEKNFVTKFNHVTHLAWVCTTCPCPMGYPQPGPRGRYRSKSGGRITIEYKKVVHKAGPRKE